MDVDAFVAVHRPAWDRLDALLRRRRTLTGAQIDELLDLYGRTATQLSMLRSADADPALVGRLSSSVARARSVVTGAHAPLWRDVMRFFTVSFPVVAYRARWWWLATSVLSLLVGTAIGVWVAGSPQVQAGIGTPDDVSALVNEDFANYYSENPAGSFGLRVWLNNSWVAAQCIAFAVLLGLPIPYILFQNVANAGAIGGLMVDAGRGDVFFGLITPHGLPELSAVFLAAAVGMRLGWTVVAPGARPRAQVLAEQGRAVIAVAGGLVVVLAVSGLIEAVVTPSPLPTAVRIGIGVLAEGLLIGYVVVLGRRGVAAGETGDAALRPDVDLVR